MIDIRQTINNKVRSHYWLDSKLSVQCNIPTVSPVRISAKPTLEVMMHRPVLSMRIIKNVSKSFIYYLFITSYLQIDRSIFKDKHSTITKLIILPPTHCEIKTRMYISDQLVMSEMYTDLSAKLNSEELASEQTFRPSSQQLTVKGRAKLKHLPGTNSITIE